MSTRAIRERVQATVAKLQPPRAPKQRTKKAAPAPKALPAIVVKQPPPASLIPSKVDSVTAEALAVLRKLRGGVPAKAAKAKKAAPARRYTIQISAFRERNEAMGLVATLRKTGHNPYLVLTDMPGNGRWFRVRVGRFEDKKAATRYQARLARAKEPRNDTFITQM